LSNTCNNNVIIKHKDKNEIKKLVKALVTSESNGGGFLAFAKPEPDYNVVSVDTLSEI
jgi:hypothetical protein